MKVRLATPKYQVTRKQTPCAQKPDKTHIYIHGNKELIEKGFDDEKPWVTVKYTLRKQTPILQIIEDTNTMCWIQDSAYVGETSYN